MGCEDMRTEDCIVSGLDSWSIIFSLLLRMVCVTGPDTIIASGDYLGVGTKGTRLAMPKTNLRAGLLVIEARFRGY